ncbi:hypothetical protein [Methylobacillus flagellatus]|uniref:hypothetical protein n=1 Tax=Methylobacillus flagellatus TaxID=405 RepID=UPI0010F50438|nr:hypothetical protein [Methylobacillus flagellatus]
MPIPMTTRRTGRLCLLLGSLSMTGLLVLPAWSAEQARTPHHLGNRAQALEQHAEDLRQLMLLLYAQYPQALRKSTSVSAEEMVQWVFGSPFNWKFEAIRHAQQLSALRLGMSADYAGDRILPVITGLYTLIREAYGTAPASGMSGPDAQQLYLAARHTGSVMERLARAPQSALAADASARSAVRARLLALQQRLDQHASEVALASGQPLKRMSADAVIALAAELDQPALLD